MLNQETLNKIASLLKLDAKKLSEAIADEKEVAVAIDEKLQVYDDAALNTRDRNKYNEGKKAGEEMLVKEIKRKHSIEVDGDDADKVVEAIITKVKKEAGGSASDKEKDLESKIEQWKNKHKEAEQKLTLAEQKASEAALDRELLASFPKNRDSKLSDDEYLFLVKKTLEIEEKDGKRIVKKEGKVLENDKTLEPISLRDAIEGHFNDRKWVSDGDGGSGGADKKPGGGGGNGKPGGGAGKFTKMSEINAYLTENGLDAKGEKGAAFIAAAVKENPAIDFSS